MPDMEYWKQRARDAEQKLLDLGHKGVDKAKDLTGKGKRALDMGKAKIGIDNDEPILPQIGGAAKSATSKAGAAVSDSPVGTGAAGVRRGVDMGLTMGGANLDEPLLPQAADAVSGLGGPTLDAGARAIGKGIDAVGDTVTKTIPNAAGKAGAAIAGAGGDLKNLFLDKMLGQSGGQAPHMYQGAPDAPPAAPSPYGGDQSQVPSAPSMYGTGQETVGQQPPPNAPSMYGTGQEPNPQPSMYGSGQEAQPYMYNNQPPTVMQRGGQVMNQGKHMMQNAPEQMERALQAAEEAYRRIMGGGQ